MTLLKTVLFSWMESIFITKKIAKTEFKYRNVISLLKSNNIRYTKEEIDDVVKEFKIYKESLKSIEGNMKMVKITTKKVETVDDISWVKWTDKSKKIFFKSDKNGIGDGEEKVACELGVKIQGQNSHYDLMVNFNGIYKECDVKKLDVQNDFNTGKKGRDFIRNIKTKHILLLEAFILFSKSNLFTEDERNILNVTEDISPDELSVGTILKLHNMCIMVNSKMNNMSSSIPKIKPFENCKSMPLNIYYLICKKINIDFPKEYEAYIDVIHILNHMEHEYIFEPDKFMDDLNNLTEMFNDTTLIIVDDKKGYAFINKNKIKFLRVTRGNPRFKVIF